KRELTPCRDDAWAESSNGIERVNQQRNYRQQQRAQEGWFAPSDIREWGELRLERLGFLHCPASGMRFTQFAGCPHHTLPCCLVAWIQVKSLFEKAHAFLGIGYSSQDQQRADRAWI